jgi:hypothetical protein
MVLPFTLDTLPVDLKDVPDLRQLPATVVASWSMLSVAILLISSGEACVNHWVCVAYSG